MNIDEIPAARRLSPLARALSEARAAGCPSWAVADAAGISRSMLSRAASGQCGVSARTAHAIAVALGRPVGELFPDLTM